MILHVHKGNIVADVRRLMQLTSYLSTNQSYAMIVDSLSHDHTKPTIPKKLLIVFQLVLSVWRRYFNAVNEIRVKTDLEMGDENYFCAHANTCNLLTRFSLEIQFKRNQLKLRLEISCAMARP